MRIRVGYRYKTKNGRMLDILYETKTFGRFVAKFIGDNNLCYYEYDGRYADTSIYMHQLLEIISEECESPNHIKDLVNDTKDGLKSTVTNLTLVTSSTSYINYPEDDEHIAKNTIGFKTGSPSPSPDPQTVKTRQDYEYERMRDFFFSSDSQYGIGSKIR